MDVLPIFDGQQARLKTSKLTHRISPLQFCSGVVGPVAAVRRYAANLSTGPSALAKSAKMLNQGNQGTVLSKNSFLLLQNQQENGIKS